ncbi:2-hydroxyacid dehydrogenase [uncultured Draconibacterium sp.]|uniref:2-hydroxyacid dehydrogenase n=1 Tax=uncultured Draconibacterium sp. TaxID=1573823 RepID=UPI0029C72A41|nr:2-hydroxyacid dehydrogenase [uncultured Draconibacterium sp.]
MPRILLTNKYSSPVLEVVKSLLPAGFEFDSLDSSAKESLLKKAPLADYFLASGRLKIDKAIIDAAVNLKMIQRTGVGTDTLDLETLKNRNIPVYVNKGVNSVAVAEHTILLLFSTLRKLPMADSSVRDGVWKKNDIGIECHSLENKNIGLVGLGNIGLNVARMLKPFNVKIYYSDISRQPLEIEEKFNLQYSDFNELLPKVDILSLHCPLTLETRGILGKEEFKVMKNSAFVINTGRGSLIKQSELIAALKNKEIAGVGLDVFENEPIEKDNLLFEMKNVVLTPHVGGLTIETFSKMIRDAFSNIELFEKGEFKKIENKLLK